MSWTDARGVTHPRRSDQVTPWGYAHIACCRDCMKEFGGVVNLPLIQFGQIGPIPVEEIGLPPAPTGRAKHRKEES